MSALETSVAPLLFPAETRRTLEIGEQEEIARWLVKTAVVLNSSQNYRLMVPSHARHELAVGMSRDFGVYLAYHRQPTGQLDFAQTTGALSVTSADQVDAYQRVSEQVFGCGLAIGDLLGIVVYAAPDGWAWPTEPMAKIWPAAQALDWQTLPMVDDMQSALMLAGAHPGFRATGAMTSDEWRRKVTGQ